jgi:hypothetical protein
VLNRYAVDDEGMNTSHLSLQKARSLAHRLRTSRHNGRGWDASVDRDLARESHEIYLLAQNSSPRVI